MASYRQANCATCQRIFMARVKYPQPTKRFCSAMCRRNELRHCLNCDSTTRNPKFCSLKCSTQFNSNQRKIHKFCKDCNVEISAPSTRCRSCHISFMTKDWSKISLGQIKSRAKYQGYAVIRQLARKIYKRSNKPQMCKACGYSKHFEVTHTKAISSYNDNTPVSVINNLSNLIALCRNHHWESEHPDSC